MRILIVEDEKLAVDRIVKILRDIEVDAQIVGVTDSVESSVSWLKTELQPDIILMDIELADGKSFEIFNLVPVESPVIFTTSYDEYAIRAFKVNSVDYLLKPIKREELKTSLSKFRNFHGYKSNSGRSQGQIEQLIRQLAEPKKEYRERFLVKSGQRYLSIETEAISYFYCEDRLTYLNTEKNDRYVVDYTLDELDQLLYPKAFFRANRKYILHIKSIKGIHTYFNNKLKLTLSPPIDDEVLVSREKASEFKNWLGK